MFNEELYKKLELRYGVERMTSFAEIIAARHDLLFADSEEPLNGEDFERDWWLNKFAELSTIPKDPIIQEVVRKFQDRSLIGIKKYKTTLETNNTDDFLKHLQEELMDAVNYVQKLMSILNEKGYTNLIDVKNRNEFDNETLRIRKDDQQRLQDLQDRQRQDLDSKQ